MREERNESWKKKRRTQTWQTPTTTLYHPTHLSRPLLQPSCRHHLVHRWQPLVVHWHLVDSVMVALSMTAVSRSIRMG